MQISSHSLLELIPFFTSRSLAVDEESISIIEKNKHLITRQRFHFDDLVDVYWEPAFFFWARFRITGRIGNRIVSYVANGFKRRESGNFIGLLSHHLNRVFDSRFFSYHGGLSSPTLEDVIANKGFIRNSFLKSIKIPSLEEDRLLNSRLFERYGSTKIKNSIRDLRAGYQSIRNKVDAHNTKYCLSEIGRFSHLFDHLENYPLTEEQRMACVWDEDSNLVVAGAGTGKTSVVVGRVAYLIASQCCSPEEILLLAFTKKAAEEMNERLKKRLKLKGTQNVDVHTFHSLGYSILGKARDEKPALSKLAENNGSGYFEDFVTQLILKILQSSKYSRKMISFFAYYLNPIHSQFDFEKEGLHIEYLKEYGIATLKDISRGRDSNPYRTTFQYEYVKSYEECRIANFLFINRIEYEYEAQYPHRWSDSSHRIYQPDFYLPEYGIYIEHFGVDKKGNTAPFIDRKKYHEQMQEKRLVHKRYGTKMVETYSHELSSNNWEELLQRKLQGQGVVFKPMSPKEFQEEVLSKSKMTNRFVTLVATFLNLYKSLGITTEEIRSRARETPEEIRTNAFLEIFEIILANYQKHLEKHNEIDFHDMINMSADLVRSGTVPVKYKYIIIDEYQDISFSRYNLVKAIYDNSDSPGLTAVGDDWQSIYRFTGADVSLMSDFSSFWGFNRTHFLSETFRYPQELLDLSSRFIQQNPSQIRKALTSHFSAETPCCHAVYYDPGSNKETTKILTWILEKISFKSNQDKAHVLLLGRYNFSKPSDLSQLRRMFPKFKIDFLTAHSSKGLEADYVIILDLKTDRLGFPCSITNDPLIELVLAKPDGFDFSEERRLFYVALTRAKKEVFLMSPTSNRSVFVSEIEKYSDPITRLKVRPDGEEEMLLQDEPPCPHCGTGYLVARQGPRGSFFGCSNYPYCRFTKNIQNFF